MLYSGGFTAILDACVLYPAPLRDLLLSLADQELYRPKWSAVIQDEWIRNLLKNRDDLEKDQLIHTTETMNKVFPDAEVHDFEHLIQSIELPDPDDRHVLAAACICNADVIVTFNLKDFPEEHIQKYDIDARHPDQFITDLIHLNKEKAHTAFSQQVSRLNNPPKNTADVLEALEKNMLHHSAGLLKQIIDQHSTKGN